MSTYPTMLLTPASPADLAWFTGSWIGSAGEDTIEEHWSEPGGGTIVGMFRWIKASDGRVRFYELEAIEPEGDGVIMRVKHFDPGLVGWEAQNAAHNFYLVYLESNRAVFYERDEADPRWVVYQLEPPDRLTIWFTKDVEPVSDVPVFKLTRY